MLADDFTFENSDCTQKGKESILISMAADDSFTLGDQVVYHEDANTICGTHRMTPNEGPMLPIMYFAMFEDKEYVFWKVRPLLPT